MLSWLIEFSLRFRLLILIVAGSLGIAGVAALRLLDIDAFPDTTPVQVQINTAAPALGPEEVEAQITAPIELALGGLPKLRLVRSTSKFGLSQVVVTFADGTDPFFARQVTNERLAAVPLPEGVERPSLGPASSGLGEVLHYVVRLKGWDFSAASPEERIEKLTYLRTIQDWSIKPKLREVRGVAEVNSWGGYEKQYQVRIDPNRLIKHGRTFSDVVEALRSNNRNVGGGGVRENNQFLLVHGLGRTANHEQIGDIVVAAHDGVPIRIRDLATVETGHEIRRGAVTSQGRGEAVLGLCFMTLGENSQHVTTLLRGRLEEIRPTLPSDVELEIVYDRTELIDVVIETVRKNLFEGGLLVIAVLFAFLGNLRAAAIVALAIPLSLLCAFSGMLASGIAASLLSLGAIDFGLVVDSSVVMVENCVRHVARGDLARASLRDVVRNAAVEVRRPTLFGELIIMIVYLPILTLEGLEGKLFRPMALTVIFALAASMFFSLTLMPVLASLCLPRRIDHRPTWLMRVAHAIHGPILSISMENRWSVVVIAVTLLIVAFAGIAPQLGSEFIPRLSEGALTVNVIRLAGTDLEDSLHVNSRMERRILRAFPDEVRHVWSRVGTAEVATDPMGLELTDLFITLWPRERWKRATSQAQLVVLLERELREIPGQRLAFSQPIELRMNEMVSGVRSDLGIKLFGDDFEILVKKAAEIEGVLRKIPGQADLSVEQITGQPILSARIRQGELARYGASARTILELIEAVGGTRVGDVYEGQLCFPLIVKLPARPGRSRDSLATNLVTTAKGQQIPLERLAELRLVQGPSTITREWGQRRITISCNIRGRDMGSFVAEARRQLAEKIELPPGRYHMQWGGQYENYERARRRLLFVVPVAVVSIFILLLFTYGNLVDALRVFTGVPFGWVGGILALWLRDLPFSISAAVGFIALSGVAVLDDMILVSYVRQLRRKGMAVHDAVRAAAVTRLRPVLMTTLVASLGFLPMALSTGQGAEVQRPLATVVIGGVIGAMLMSLLVLRVLYLFFDAAARFAHAVLVRGLGVSPGLAAGLLGLDEAREASFELASGDSADLAVNPPVISS